MKKLVAILVLCMTCVFCAVGFVACDKGKSDGVQEKQGAEDAGNNTDNYSQPTGDEYFNFTLLEDDTYAIRAKDVNNMPANVVLPKNHDGKSVTSVGDLAFYHCSGLTSVTIPDSVTSIGFVAFGNCISLQSVIIPDSVTSMGESLFGNCISLTSITIPNGVTSIGDHMFYNCSNLMDITIPNSVTSIADRAFYNCSKLTSITIQNSVTSIASEAFSNCISLASVTIPDSVTSIEGYAFSNCISLASVTFNNINGWKVSYPYDMSDAIDILSSDLANTSTAAQYLTNTYNSRYWQRG